MLALWVAGPRGLSGALSGRGCEAGRSPLLTPPLTGLHGSGVQGLRLHCMLDHGVPPRLGPAVFAGCCPRGGGSALNAPGRWAGARGGARWFQGEDHSSSRPALTLGAGGEGACPQQHQSWGWGAGTHGCATYGPSGRGGAVVSVVGVLALGPLLGVGQKGTDMAWTRGSDHALEAC